MFFADGHMLTMSEVGAMQRCYRTGGSPVLTVIGAALLIAGAVVLFVCIPGWAWCGVIGVILIAAGFLLVKLGSAGR